MEVEVDCEDEEEEVEEVEELEEVEEVEELVEEIEEEPPQLTTTTGGGQLTRWWFKWVPMNWGVGACKNVVLYPFRISTPGLRTSKKGIFQRTKNIIKHLPPVSELAPRMPPVAASASDGKAKGILGTKMKGACAII